MLAWLHGGDCRNGWRRDFEAERVVPDENGQRWPTEVDAAIARWFRTRRRPLLLTRGNHDTADPYGAFAHGEDVTGRVVEVAPGLFVGGLGWSGLMFADLPGEGEMARVCASVQRQALRLLRKDDRLILLTHYAAALPNLFTSGIENGSFHCIRALIDELRPIAVIQGHFHTWFGTDALYTNGGWSTLVANPGPRGVELHVDVGAGSAWVARPLSPAIA